jgi:hypothetical protein
MTKNLIRKLLANLSDGDRRITGFIPVRMAWRLMELAGDEAEG